MPKGKTDTKRFEKQEKRHMRNRSVRATVRTFVTRAKQTIAGRAGEETTQESILQAIKVLDRAARKGIIHRNNAARRKSRLVKQARAQAAA